MYHSTIPDDPNMPESVRKSKEACAKWLATPRPEKEAGNYYGDPEYWENQEAARKASFEMDQEGQEYIRRHKLSLGCTPKGTGPICCAECREQSCSDRIYEE